MGGLNTYGYVYQNPINYIDPDGRWAVAIPALLEAIGATLNAAAGIGFGLCNLGIGCDNDNGGDKSLPGALNKNPNDEGESCPIPGATPGDKTKGRTKNFDKPGGLDQANDDFDNLNPSDVRDITDSKGGNGRTGILPDGSRVNVRPNSSGGQPTVEIQTGKTKIKVRYY